VQMHNMGHNKEQQGLAKGGPKHNKDRVNLGPTPLTCCAKHIRQGDGQETSKSTNPRKHL
jgi:hypothetical protein